MSDLASLKTRVSTTLNDTGGTRFSTGMLDEALRQALHEYSKAWPLMDELDFTVTVIGRDQAISALNTCQAIYEVIYPYDSSEDYEPHIYGYGRVVPHKSVLPYFHYGWKKGVLTLHVGGPKNPGVGEHILVKYMNPQTIKDLDSATTTTVQADHEAMLVEGAAGHAAVMKSNIMGTFPDMTGLNKWGAAQEVKYTLWLADLRAQSARQVSPFSQQYWRLDGWDGNPL
jgi:hypothetical protein